MNARDAQFAKSISTAPPLFAHQQQSITKLTKTPLLFDQSDPGTGKSRVQIEAFAKRRRKNGGRAIITATKSLLESAWKNDFMKFAPDMSVICAYANNRKAAFNSDADVIVTNHDGVNWLAKQKVKFFKGFDTIIHDESTAFKHHTSARSKAAAKIADHFQYRSCMTGTPMSNGICDIWHQVYLLDDGERLGREFKAFKKAACNYVPSERDARFGDWVDREGIETIITTLIQDISIRHEFDDCVDIPKNHRYAVPFQMSNKHRQVYKEMYESQLLELKDKTITAVNGGALYQKMLQIASGAVYASDNDWATLDTDRYQLVLDLVEERQHSIVFFTWEHQRDELVKEAERRGISFAVYDGKTKDSERAKIVDDYQAGRYRTLFAHPKSAGHGLTLTKGTATIWASPTYNLEHFLQGLKRIHRIGQTERTETIVVVAENSIDEQVWQVCQHKDAKQGDFLKLLREITR